MTRRPDANLISPPGRPTDPPPRLTDFLARHRRWILAAIVLAYLAGLAGTWQWGRDSVMHVALAKSLVEQGELSHPLAFERTVQPGLAYLVAGGLKLGGGDSLWPAHLAMLGIALATLGIVYLWARRITDTGAAVAIVAMVAVCETYFRYGYQLLTDLPFALGAATALLGWEMLREKVKSPGGWAVLIVGVAIMYLFRSVFSIYVAAMLVTVAVMGATRWPRTTAAVGVGVIAAGGAALALGPGIEIDPRSDLAIALRPVLDPLSFFDRGMLTNLRGLLFESTGEAAFGVDLGAIACAAVSLVIWASLLLLVRVRLLWGVLVLGFLTQWVLFWPLDRYFLAILPLVAVAWWRAANFAWTRLGPPYRDWLWAAMLLLWLVPNAGKLAQYAWQRHTTEPAVYALADLADHPDPRVRAAASLEDATEPDAVILTDAYEFGLMLLRSDRAVISIHEGWRVDLSKRPVYAIGPYEDALPKWVRQRGGSLGERQPLADEQAVFLQRVRFVDETDTAGRSRPGGDGGADG